MKPVKVGICGLGTVGGGTFNVLKRNAEEIARRAGRGIEVAQIAARDTNPKCDTSGTPITADVFDLVNNPEIDIIIELIGGALIILGLFTRPVAFILSGQMAAAYFIGHVAGGGNFLVPILNSGELAVQWCFTFLFFFVAGGGAFALDNLRHKA